MYTSGSAGNDTEPTLNAPYLEKYWLICESLLVTFTFISIYLIVCLMKHALGQKTNRRTQHYCQKAWLNWLCVFSAIALFFRVCCNHFVAFYGWQSDDACLITVTTSTVLHMISLYSIYVFLWVRQNVFYANPIMKTIIPKWITWVSWSTLGFMLFTGIAVGVLYNLPQVTGWQYRATADGCTDISGHDSSDVVPGVGVAGTILFQIVLLALFIYPLLSREMARFRGPTGTDEKNQSTSFSHSAEDNQLKDDNDEVFLVTQPTASVPTNSAFPRQTPPMSPLARTSASRLIKTPRASAETDTGNESGADVGRSDGDKLWTKNATIKRGGNSPGHFSKTTKRPKRKSVMERLKSVGPGSVFYHRAKRNSFSSEYTASPAVSDTETRSRGNTLRRALHKQNKKGRKLVVLMKRYALLMLVCSATDICSAVVQSLIILPELVYLVLYDINLMINLLCAVITFADWRRILFSCAINNEEKSTAISVNKLRRRPTPPRRRSVKDRVQVLRQEGRRPRSRGSSGSGYESGDSGHSPIYRPAPESHALIRSER